jgi:peptidoglycan/xylan/chitin deacetylase (PgdA/CDA1 family)
MTWFRKGIAVLLVCSLLTFSVRSEERISNVYHAHSNSGMKIALTFDDGPHPRLTPKILDILKRYHIHATFFIIGKNAELYPHLVERILSEGHEIGNHTYSHNKVVGCDFGQIKREVEHCESVIYEIADYKTKLIRPPEGFLDDNVKAIAQQMDYNIILWNIDTLDWAHKSPADICQNISKNISQGSIILMHDYIGYHSPTPEALALFIPVLLERGYQFSVVSDLIGSK